MQLSRDIEKYTKDYINSDFEDVMVAYRRKKVLEILNTYNPKNILEIGCGLSSIGNYYKTYNNLTIVEPSKSFASSCIKEYNPNIKIINDFIENQIETLKKQQYDFILLSGLLHEVCNPEEFFNLVLKLCSQKTIIHINVPNSKSFHLLWAYKSHMIEHIGDLSNRAKILQQHTTFNLESLTTFIEVKNLEIIDKGSYFIKPFDHSKMQKCLDNEIIDNNLLDGLYKMTKFMPEFGAEIFVNCRLKQCI